MKKNELPAGITQAQIDEAKEKYGDIIHIAELPTSDEQNCEKLNVLVKVPDRRSIGEFEKWIDKNPNKAKEILIKANVLTSVSEVLANDYTFFASVDAVAELMPIRKSILKNC